MESSKTLPKPFILRRLHSATGFFLVLYLIEHLLINSQAALLPNGTSFIDAVNAIHALPFLPIIEIGLLGIPIAIHACLGIAYLREGRMNSIKGDGTTPYLPEYPRNRAYTWQRITSWILLLAILGHVIHMRLIEYPTAARPGPITPENPLHYMVRLQKDAGLQSLAKRLGVILYTKEEIARSKMAWETVEKKPGDRKQWFAALENRSLQPGEVIASSPNFGTAELLMVRETFKMPLMIALYTIFVLSACFHAFNGVWTFLITWGVTLTPRVQNYSLYLCLFLMYLVAFLGLSTIWGSYWINLKS